MGTRLNVCVLTSPQAPQLQLGDKQCQSKDYLMPLRSWEPPLHCFTAFRIHAARRRELYWHPTKLHSGGWHIVPQGCNGRCIDQTSSTMGMWHGAMPCRATASSKHGSTSNTTGQWGARQKNRGNLGRMESKISADVQDVSA